VAARRLIAVMLVLLFLSSLAAALAPVDTEREDTAPTPVPTEPVTDEASEGELVREELDARGKRTPMVRARVGDQLQLRVRSERPATVELVGLGLTEDVDPLAPARFDLLLERPGTIKVRELESPRRPLGTIEVSRPARKASPKARAPARS
jgi:hypothetical protein